MAIAKESQLYQSSVEKIADREQAIKAAMAITNQELDAVIIAGKGADCYQIVQGKKEDLSWRCGYRRIVIYKIKGNIPLIFLVFF